jgi:RNA polymerase sigma-70 factor (ECF subfamily)
MSELLCRARAGDEDALGTLLQRYRPQLQAMAQRQLESAVKPRVSASDVVQQTCLEAHRDLPGFRGETEPEFVAWLRRILSNNLAQTVQQHVFTAKRTTDKERRLETDDSTGNPQPISPTSTPSAKVRRQETEEELLAAIDRLPEDQREAVRVRHLQGRSLKQLAEHFGRSEVAVAGLLKRGMQKLRHLLDNTHER